MKLNLNIGIFIISFVAMNVNVLNAFSQGPGVTVLSQDSYANQTIQISQVCDLKNRTITFNDCILEFSENGKIINGNLGGKGNIIKSQKSSILSGVVFPERFIDNSFYISWWYIPGSSDKTTNNTKIQEVLNSIPDGSKLIFDQKYDILCDPVFNMTGKNGITIDFRNSHFYTDKSAGPSSAFFLLNTSTNITFSNLSILGDIKYHNRNDKGEWGMGINIQGCNTVVIENSTINQCWGDNIYITGDKEFNPSRNISIKNCNLIDGRRNNISIINADGVNIQSCMISRTNTFSGALQATGPFVGIDMEPNKPDIEKVSNIIIKDCQFNLANVARVGVQNYNNPRGGSFYISNCTFSDMRNGFYLTKSKQIVIESCTFNNISSNPVILNGVTDIQIMNNTFSSVPKPRISVEDNFDLLNVSNYTFKNNLIRK